MHNVFSAASHPPDHFLFNSELSLMQRAPLAAVPPPVGTDGGKATK